MIKELYEELIQLEKDSEELWNTDNVDPKIRLGLNRRILDVRNKLYDILGEDKYYRLDDETILIMDSDDIRILKRYN